MWLCIEINMRFTFLLPSILQLSKSVICYLPKQSPSSGPAQAFFYRNISDHNTNADYFTHQKLSVFTWQIFWSLACHRVSTMVLIVCPNCCSAVLSESTKTATSIINHSSRFKSYCFGFFFGLWIWDIVAESQYNIVTKIKYLSLVKGRMDLIERICNFWLVITS